MRPEVRTALATLLLPPPALICGFGFVVREEWCVRAVMGVTSAVLIVTTSSTLRRDNSIILKSKQNSARVAGRSEVGFSLLCLRCDDDRA
jgi:hypothetical protein